jgi:hypothetical protein
MLPILLLPIQLAQPEIICRSRCSTGPYVVNAHIEAAFPFPTRPEDAQRQMLHWWGWEMYDNGLMYDWDSEEVKKYPRTFTFCGSADRKFYWLIYHDVKYPPKISWPWDRPKPPHTD